MRTIVATSLFALVLAACGTGAETAATTTEPLATTTTEAMATTTTEAMETTTSQAAVSGAVVSTSDSDLGMILVDEEGMTLYILTADEEGESTCYDQCAGAWPPVITDGDPQAEGEVDASLLGTTTRDDGSTQVTYGGWPLYLFVQDSEPGDVNGQGIQSFGGTWWVIGPDGEPIEES